MNKLSLVTSDATSDTSRHISFCLCCWHCITSSFKCDTFSNNVAHLCFNWITSNLHLKILLNNIKTKTVVKQMLKLSTGSKVCWEGRVTLPYHFSCPQYRQNSAPTREADLSSRPLTTASSLDPTWSSIPNFYHVLPTYNILLQTIVFQLYKRLSKICSKFSLQSVNTGANWSRPYVGVEITWKSVSESNTVFYAAEYVWCQCSLMPLVCTHTQHDKTLFSLFSFQVNDCMQQVLRMPLKHCCQSNQNGNAINDHSLLLGPQGGRVWLWQEEDCANWLG